MVLPVGVLSRFVSLLLPSQPPSFLAEEVCHSLCFVPAVPGLALAGELVQDPEVPGAELTGVF